FRGRRRRDFRHRHVGPAGDGIVDVVGTLREKQPQTGLHIGDFIGTAGGTQPFIRAILHRHARCRSPQNAARGVYIATAKKNTEKIIAIAYGAAGDASFMQPQLSK
ncbi:hypothetical protein, partial [Mesorhizobium sp. M1C.F.Ca.ET.196.01.1.1]|uniref:hypothetical protein n=1 Tax=Mesorhizobium sp. M1C.F.Ca.ET.196.01.1.1 TaxID=2563928 RepID=UPI001678E0D7